MRSNVRSSQRSHWWSPRRHDTFQQNVAPINLCMISSSDLVDKVFIIPSQALKSYVATKLVIFQVEQSQRNSESFLHPFYNLDRIPLTIGCLLRNFLFMVSVMYYSLRRRTFFLAIQPYTYWQILLSQAFHDQST